MLLSVSDSENGRFANRKTVSEIMFGLQELFRLEQTANRELIQSEFAFSNET